MSSTLNKVVFAFVRKISPIQRNHLMRNISSHHQCVPKRQHHRVVWIITLHLTLCFPLFLTALRVLPRTRHSFRTALLTLESKGTCDSRTDWPNFCLAISRGPCVMCQFQAAPPLPVEARRGEATCRWDCGDTHLIPEQLCLDVFGPRPGLVLSGSSFLI